MHQGLIDRRYWATIHDGFILYEANHGLVPLWTESIFTEFMVEGLPEFADVIRAAGATLYRSALHHGAYPFSPDRTSTMRLEALAVAVAMLTTVEQERFSRFVRLDPDSPYGWTRRPRNSRERRRLVFQSRCSTADSDAGTLRARDSGDDEDLLDVLVRSLPNQHPKSCYTPDRMRPTAAKLPSSFSQRLDGKIALQDLRSLLALLVLLNLAPCKVRPQPASSWHAELDAVTVSLLRSFETHQGAMATDGIGWETFDKVVAESMVRAYKDPCDLY